jgi:hypothetical protein
MKKASLRITRSIVFMIGMVAAVMTIQAGQVQAANRTCSLATLKGRYQFASSGFVVINGAPVPLAVAGIDILDGNGNISSTSTLIVGGAVVFQNLNVPNGTYTVSNNCTGTLTLGASGVVLNIFVQPDGGAYDYVQTAPSGNILAGTIRRVSDSTEAEQ